MRVVFTLAGPLRNAVQRGHGGGEGQLCSVTLTHLLLTMLVPQGMLCREGTATLSVNGSAGQYVHMFVVDYVGSSANTVQRSNKQWEVIALEQLTSHLTLNAGPQQQRLESPMITPPGMQ